MTEFLTDGPNSHLGSKAVSWFIFGDVSSVSSDIQRLNPLGQRLEEDGTGKTENVSQKAMRISKYLAAHHHGSAFHLENPAIPLDI